MALQKLHDANQDDISSYNDAEAAINTVQARKSASGDQKLRKRWVHDVHRNESIKMGLNLSPNSRGTRKTQPKGTARHHSN